MCAPLQAPTIIYEVHLHKSKKVLLPQFQASYNTGKSLGNRIRSPHMRLMERIIELYWAHLNSHQKVLKKPLVEGMQLPVLKTSNGALAKAMNGVSKQTIINLRKRLAEAGMLIQKCWHGTNAAYELWINPMLLFLRDSAAKGSKNMLNFNHLFFSSIVKTFDHTESGTSYPVQVTNKEKNKKGEDTASIVENSQTKEEAVPSKSKNQATSSCDRPSVIQNPPNGQTKQETNPPELRAAPLTPPQNRPDSIEEALAHLSPKDALAVKMIASICWGHAQAQLYTNDWLTDKQKQGAIIGIAEYIAWNVQPKAYNQAKAVVLKRIDMVSDWLKWKSERWIDLPEAYFNMRNTKRGFVCTENWYNRYKKRCYVKARQTAITKAANKYMKTLLPNSSTDRQEAHHQLTQSLRKKYGTKAVIAFEERINNLILNMKS